MEVVFFNQPWRETAAARGPADRAVRQGRRVPGRVADDEPDRRPDRRPHRPHRADLSAEREGAAEHVGDRRLGRGGAARVCRERGIADPVPGDGARAARPGRPRRRAAARSTCRRRWATRRWPRRRLAFDELLRVQTVLVMRKRELERERGASRHDVDGELVGGSTGAAVRADGRTAACRSARSRSTSPRRTRCTGCCRVTSGSGKTVVAVAALLAAVQGGHQGALMAPTEVLAEQHATSVRAMSADLSVPDPGNLFGDRPLRVELLTNRVTGGERRSVLAGLADGIGRHRHRHPRPDPGGRRVRSLGVVVVDEQHRFGVEQRAALRTKARRRGRCPTCS